MSPNTVAFTTIPTRSTAQQIRYVKEPLRQPSSLSQKILFSTPRDHQVVEMMSLPISLLASDNSVFRTPTPSTTFEPILPDITMLIGYSVIVILCIIAANVWSNDVVPISRTKLAIAKQQNSNSTLRLYLNELLDIENASATIVSNATTAVLPVPSPDTVAEEFVSGIELQNDKTLNVKGNDFDVDVDVDPMIPGAKNRRFQQPQQGEDQRVFERWLFTDWLVKDRKLRKSGRQKEPAIPVLKNAKWNSGDNPVLVATTLIFLGVLFTSITERITSSSAAAVVGVIANF